MTNEQLTKLVSEQIQRQLAGKLSPVTCHLSTENPVAAPFAYLAPTIEHSLLNPDITREKVIAGCGDAVKYGFANVCVTPWLVVDAVQRVSGSSVLISAPVGFPHAAASLAAKSAEIRYCVQSGARELDLSLNIVAARSGQWDVVYRELCEMLNVAGDRVVCKAIYEQGLYSDEEKKRVLDVIERSRAPYLKISNALTGKKAEAEDVRFVRAQIGTRIGIKIDGGIATPQKILELQAAGAQRFGCSASVAIVTYGG
ncbi:MAG: deoxyribose-phosphate aldolase [Clostridiales bacterium]|nr:deoxyribose-phosphate aldolase [Clostridiales bacterium]